MTGSMQPPSLPEAHAPERTFARLTREERRGAAMAAAAIVAVLGLAAILTPDERGLGTHQQLGLPPCMTETVFGIPCPFCGMTTSFSHMAHGQIAEAITVQPAGALGFVVAAALALGCIVTVATGTAPTKWKAVRHSPYLYAIAGVIIATAWVYKVLSHTDIIQH